VSRTRSIDTSFICERKKFRPVGEPCIETAVYLEIDARTGDPAEGEFDFWMKVFHPRHPDGSQAGEKKAAEKPLLAAGTPEGANLNQK
jgi:hypothetical protein